MNDTTEEQGFIKRTEQVSHTNLWDSIEVTRPPRDWTAIITGVVIMIAVSLLVYQVATVIIDVIPLVK